MCEGGGRGEEGAGRAFYYTYITAGKDSPAREPTCLALWLQKPVVAEAFHPACVCEGGGPALWE
jgi:hypothetical protein